MTEERTVDIVGYARSLLRYWLVALVVLVVVGAGAFLLMRPGATFSAKAQLIALPAQATTEAQALINQQNQGLILRSYQNMATSVPILDLAVRKLGGKYTSQEVAQLANVQYGGGSLMLAVQVPSAPTREEATGIANAVAESLVEKGNSVLGMDGQPYAPTLKLIEPARIVTPDQVGLPGPQPASVRMLTAAALGVVAAMVAMVVAQMLTGRRESD